MVPFATVVTMASMAWQYGGNGNPLATSGDNGVIRVRISTIVDIFTISAIVLKGTTVANQPICADESPFVGCLIRF